MRQIAFLPTIHCHRDDRDRERERERVFASHERRTYVDRAAASCRSASKFPPTHSDNKTCTSPAGGTMASSKLLLLAVLSTVTTKVVADPAPLQNPPNGFVYAGCFIDNQGFRALANRGPAEAGADDDMTIENCINACSTGEYSYSYVGLQYYYEVCFLPVERLLVADIVASVGVQMSWISAARRSQSPNVTFPVVEITMRPVVVATV